jgi:hypothetical protein
MFERVIIFLRQKIEMLTENDAAPDEPECDSISGSSWNLCFHYNVQNDSIPSSLLPNGLIRGALSSSDMVRVQN